jgi:hypothetical protein
LLSTGGDLAIQKLGLAEGATIKLEDDPRKTSHKAVIFQYNTLSEGDFSVPPLGYRTHIRMAKPQSTSRKDFEQTIASATAWLFMAFV